MVSRTYGWVQNPSDFQKLKLVVQIFDSTSEHYHKLKDNIVSTHIYFEETKQNLLTKLCTNTETFSYLELVGTSKDKNGKSPKQRKDAVADSLIQVTVLPQNYKTSGKCWSDNWTSDGFLRWALSLNFVSHDRETDICSITKLGKQFSQSADNSDEERNILQSALLCYPPATQILSLLESSQEAMTKFAIGSQLGFVGEKGFTSYDEGIMLDWFINSTSSEQNKIKSDVEGTSDKYARMITNWLYKLGLVTKANNKIETINGDKSGFQVYQLTGKGSHAIRQAHGSSKNKKVTKYFTWEFLATDGANRDYIRTRRAYILKSLQQTKSFKVLLEGLQELGFEDSKTVIENDIRGLNTFGIRIERNGNSVVLKDNISDFSIPNLQLTDELKDQVTEQRKAEFMKSTDLPVKYLELLEIAFNGKRDRDFEVLTADLFKNMYGLHSIRLGGGRKPDGVVYTSRFGIITDTKAYSNGYSKDIKEEDKMVRYIEDNQKRDSTRNPTNWWQNFDTNITQSNFYFMWISGRFVGQFQEQLISTANRTNCKGSALSVEQLLLGADAVQKGKLNIDDIPKYIDNTEINWLG